MNTLKKEIEIKVTPEELAKVFCSMDEIDQALFFNEIAKDAKSWNFDYQMHMVQMCNELNTGGLGVMRLIGNPGGNDE